MQDEYSEYREYLREGMRIEVGIPLSGGGIFRDWAIISESRQDLLLAQISRDMLPADVRFDVGFILDVSVWIKKDVYTCSGIVTEKLGGRVLRIRLFGHFTLRERRQFFRIDLNMRLKYGVIADSSRNDVERDWEMRRDHEHMKFQGYDEIVIAALKARYSPSKPVDWQDMLSAQMNIGGGGVRLRLPEPVYPDQLLNLEIHLPITPSRQVQAVGRVVHVMPKAPKDGSPACFDAGMQFLFLDERDRDLIFKQISVAQIAHLRKIADRREPVELNEPRAARPLTRREIFLRVLWVLLFLALSYALIRYLISYRQAPPSNEIQKTYEKAIRQYRHLDR